MQQGQGAKTALMATIVSAIIMLGNLLFGAQFTWGRGGLGSKSSPLLSPGKDSLVNEQKMRDILSVEKTDERKKIKFLELYAYKHYMVSAQLIPFLVEKMKEPEITMPILQLLLGTGWRFEVNELAPFCQPYVNACVAKKNWKKLDELLGLMKHITPVTPLPSSAWTFDGQNSQYGIFENSLWKQSDEYLAYCIGQKERIDLLNCARDVLKDRHAIYMEKIKPDGSGITENVLSLYLGKYGVYASHYIGKKDVPKILALLENKKPCMANNARMILRDILYLNLDANFKQWWQEREKKFSFKEYLLDIVMDKKQARGARTAGIQHIRMQIMRGDDDFDEAYLRKLSSVLLDNSESDDVRLTVYMCLSWIVKDHVIMNPDSPNWKDILMQPAAVLFDHDKFYRAIVTSTPAEAITGVLREKFRVLAMDKKQSPSYRGAAVRVLGRGCATYKEHRQADARLALDVADDYAKYGGEVETFLHPQNNKSHKKLSPSATAMYTICQALEKITGRTDCGYDIEKWRAVVAELEAKAKAKAAHGVTGAK